MMVASGAAHALGMGEIEVNTSLNEPLNAKIKLFSATAEELDSLKINMAPQEVFNRMGLDRMPMLRDLQFELVSKGKGAPYIKVSSPKPVKEPFLDFILAINWSNGQMMREYTLLLDPPVFEQGRQDGRISAVTTAPEQVVREEASAQPRVTPPGSYGPTERTDTLWAVAKKMRPDNSVSVPQMMIGLLKENPEAFEDNNINNLKAGYVLRQPEMDVIKQLNKQEAAAESNRQYQAWLAAKGQAPGRRQQRVAGSAPLAATAKETAAAPAAVTPKTADAGARLQLLSPDEEARIRAGVGSGTSGDAAKSLQQQLAVAQETAEATHQENIQLRSRLDELEKQLQSVQKLLTLKDGTLGAMQASAQKEAAATAPVPEKAAPEQPAAEQKAKAPAVVAKKPAKPAAKPRPAEVSLLDEVLGNPTYLYAAGGGLVILLLVVAMIMRRKRQADEGDFSAMTPVAEMAEAGQAAEEGAGASAVTATGADEGSEEDSAIGDIGGMGTIHAEESEIDPIAEADVYLAYRRYEQAEALLKEAISADDDRQELKLKLLEIYHATKDVDSFEAQAESLYAALGGQNPELWNQAVEMGRELLPDHPLFSEGGVVSDTAGDEADLGAEPPDAGDELSFESEEQPVAEDSDALSDDDLAGSLGMPGLDEATEEEQAGSEEADMSLDDLGDLDLDFDLGESADLDLDAGEGSEAEIALDDLDLGDEGLEDLSAMAEEASDEDVLDLGAELRDADEEALDLGVELESDAGETGAEEELLDLADALDESLVTAAESADVAESGEAEEKQELSLADDDSHLDESENPYANADPDSFSSSASESWDVEVAHSVFHSQDVEGETDGLLDTHRKKEEPDNSVDMEEDIASMMEEDADTTIGQEASTLAEEERIDPLADIADLGDMDFGNLSDEDNDDIFDSSDDVIGTKLDLAKAYIDMGDQDGARSMLDEVAEEGDDDQRQQAEQLRQQIS